MSELKFAAANRSRAEMIRKKVWLASEAFAEWLPSSAELPDDALDLVAFGPRDPSAVRKLADMVDDGETTE